MFFYCLQWEALLTFTACFHHMFCWCLCGWAGRFCLIPPRPHRGENCELQPKNCLQIGFLQVVVISIKEEIENVFSKHLVPFFYLDVGWISKKFWRGMKVTERPALCDGPSAHSVQDNRTAGLFFFNMWWSHFTLSLCFSSGINFICVCVCVCVWETEKTGSPRVIQFWDLNAAQTGTLIPTCNSPCFWKPGETRVNIS